MLPIYEKTNFNIVRKKTGLCIIVINYHASQQTAACIDSFKYQAFDTLLLLDNSTDVTQFKAIERLGQSLQQLLPDSNIFVLSGKENLGFSAGINTAIRYDSKQTGGHPFYLLLNNDVLLTESSLRIMLKHMRSNSKLGLVAPAINWSGKLQTYNYYQKHTGHISLTPSNFSDPYLTGCCLLVNSELIVDDELLDEDFFMYGEDILLNHKALLYGKSIKCIKSLKIEHHGSFSSRPTSLFYEYHITRGHLLLALKLERHFIMKLGLLTGRFFYLFVRALLRSFRCQRPTALIALFLAWCSLLKPFNIQP